MKSSVFSINTLMLAALVEGYANLTEDALEREEEKVKAEKKLIEMKLNALEQVKGKKRESEDLP